MGSEPPESAKGTRACPDCHGVVSLRATQCVHCGAPLSVPQTPAQSTPSRSPLADMSLRAATCWLLVSIGVTLLSFGIGLGLLALLPLTACIVFGVTALRAWPRARQTPGYVLSALGAVLLFVFVVVFQFETSADASAGVADSFEFVTFVAGPLALGCVFSVALVIYGLVKWGLDTSARR